MGGGFSLGRIAGAEIRLNWSLLVIFWLIALSLAMVVFPQSVAQTSRLGLGCSPLEVLG